MQRHEEWVDELAAGLGLGVTGSVVKVDVAAERVNQVEDGLRWLCNEACPSVFSGWRWLVCMTGE